MNKDDLHQQIALFRYSLIAPAVANTFEAASMAAYFRSVASKAHQAPNGKTVSVSVYALERWYYQYKRSGLPGITPTGRSDFGTPRSLSVRAIEYIWDTKEHFPHITGKAIYKKMIEDGVIRACDTSLATIHRYIRKHGLKTPKVGANAVKTFELEYVNDCWQADTSRGPVIKINGKKHQTFLISFIDDASRMLLHTQFYLNDNAVNMQDSFKQAIAKFGVPKRLYVDNGRSYDNLQLKYICASIGIVLIHARPYAGSAKGKIERVFRTIKDGWMHTVDWNLFSSLDDLNSALAVFLSEQYTNSEHASLKQSPKERFLKEYQRLRFIPIEELDLHFLHRKECRVTNAATIKLAGTEYETPQKYIGDKVKVRYLPTDLSRLFIFSADNVLLHTIYPVKKIENSKIKRTYIDYTNEEG